MPVSQEEWNREVEDGSVEGQILRFLRENHPDAYNSREIRRLLFNNWANPDGFFETLLVGLGEAGLQQQIQDALDSLVEKGLAERKTIEEEYGFERDYYRFKA